MMPFTFKLVTSKYFLLLFNWFQQDYISQLWVEPKEWPQFETKWQEKSSESDVFRYIAIIDEEPVGYIQYFRVNDSDRAHFPGVNIPESSIGFDLFIGNPAYLNKGLGTQLIKDFISFVRVLEPHCSTIIIDPAPDNIRAIKCYEKVGFKKIGLFNTPYGPIGSGPGEILLMINQL
jgi:RimJ/RimL family protein N-acetyltransferase